VSLAPQLRIELRSLFTPGPRMVDEAECVLSVMLAILLAHAIGAHNISWAAFTGFVLMRGRVAETLLRGVLRLIGTATGAILALATVPWSASNLPLASILAAMVGAISLYGMLTTRRAYAWLLFGITFEMILLDTIEHPLINIADFVRTRLLEVSAGTVACVTVSALAALTVRRRWPAPLGAQAANVGWHPHAARHATQGGIALALLPSLHALFGLPQLAQAGVTIMAVMIVPVAGLGSSGLSPVSQRLFQRILGCLAGSLLAALVLFAARGEAWILAAGTCVGVIIGRHIENGGGRIAYVGVQFTLAILVTLVPDSYADAAIHPALMRLAAIFVGMALLEPVLLAWHYLLPARTLTTGVASRDTGGE
jgi:uncharacterized membrane protein YccC